jgi:hypothetical protein
MFIFFICEGHCLDAFFVALLFMTSHLLCLKHVAFSILGVC